jgi:hypothetical protein
MKTQTRTMAIALAGGFALCAIFGAFWLHAALLQGADSLAQWVKASWTDAQIETVMHYSGPLALILLALALALIFGSSLAARKP